MNPDSTKPADAPAAATPAPRAPGAAIPAPAPPAVTTAGRATPTEAPADGTAGAASAPAALVAADREGRPVQRAGAGFTRRSLMRGAALGGLAAAAGGALQAGTALPAAATETGPQTGGTRADAARSLRYAAADFQRSFPLPDHPDNGDEARYPDRWASYSKALPHGSEADVDTGQYATLLTALASGKASDFEAVRLGGDRKLVDPLAAYTFSLEGADPHAFAVPQAPTATSDQLQGEMAELYWMALARDIPFDSYANDGSGIISAAAGDLTGFRDLRGPKSSGAVTAQTLFRDVLPDNTSGPYLSQFLLLTVPYGNQQIFQTTRRAPGGDRLTVWSDWLNVQQGISPTPVTPSTDYRYIRNGRDLAEYVHADFPAQAVLNAARIIAAQGTLGDPKSSPRIDDPNNPYRNYAKQIGFVTFGNQMFFDLVTRAAQLALQAAWYQKWLVHRRLRPEEYGGRVESALNRGRQGTYTIGDQLTASLRDSNRLGRVPARANGSFLLPQAFPEGSPAHPAYPSGHSTYVGAGVTMIKAFVDGTVAVTNPMRLTDPNNGDNLTPLSATLTINQELDKLAANIGLARLHAGVHWRSDHTYGLLLGELVAIRALQDLARTYAEPFNGWDLRRFDGTTVTITATSVTQNGTPAATINKIT